MAREAILGALDVGLSVQPQKQGRRAVSQSVTVVVERIIAEGCSFCHGVFPKAQTLTTNGPSARIVAAPDLRIVCGMSMEVENAISGSSRARSLTVCEGPETVGHPVPIQILVVHRREDLAMTATVVLEDDHVILCWRRTGLPPRAAGEAVAMGSRG